MFLRIHLVVSGDQFIGYYEHHGFDTGGTGKNDWHYLNIKKEGAKYIWKNAAGVQWSLYPRTEDTLTVGTDCPYYSGGHTIATFENGGVQGPGGFYQNEG